MYGQCLCYAVVKETKDWLHVRPRISLLTIYFQFWSITTKYRYREVDEVCSPRLHSIAMNGESGE